MAMSARVVRLQNEGMTDSMAQDSSLRAAKESEVSCFSPNVSHHCLDD